MNHLGGTRRAWYLVETIRAAPVKRRQHRLPRSNVQRPKQTQKPAQRMSRPTSIKEDDRKRGKAANAMFYFE